MVGEETSDLERAEIRETLGLNDPIPVQFTRFVRNASKGNFGISYQLRRPVSELNIRKVARNFRASFYFFINCSCVWNIIRSLYWNKSKKLISDIILAVYLCLGVSLAYFCNRNFVYISFCSNSRKSYLPLVEVKLLILVFGLQGF